MRTLWAATTLAQQFPPTIAKHKSHKYEYKFFSFKPIWNNFLQELKLIEGDHEYKLMSRHEHIDRLYCFSASNTVLGGKMVPCRQSLRISGKACSRVGISTPSNLKVMGHDIYENKKQKYGQSK